MMGIKEILKSYIAISGLTLTDIQKELNKINGTNHGVQNLSKKIRNGTLRYSEIQQIADILGYEITWVKKDTLVTNNGSNEYKNFIVETANNLNYIFYMIQNLPPEIIQPCLTNGKYDPKKAEELIKNSQNNK